MNYLNSSSDKSWFFMRAKDIQLLRKTDFVYTEALVLFLLSCKIILLK